MKEVVLVLSDKAMETSETCIIGNQTLRNSYTISSFIDPTFNLILEVWLLLCRKLGPHRKRSLHSIP